MQTKTLIAAALLAFALPAVAQDNKTPEGAAGDHVIASNPESFVKFFEAAGYPARLSKDSVDDPLVEFRHNGDKLSLFFYDCDDNVNCQAVQFYAGYNTEGDVTLETLNTWNAERRFVRSYLTEDNVARIEMDVATSNDGISYRDFEAVLDLWLESTEIFEDHIDW